MNYTQRRLEKFEETLRFVLNDYWYDRTPLEKQRVVDELFSTSITQAIAEERERERVREREEKYQQLIMAVTSAYKGETRHETALRYIQGAEISDIGQAKDTLVSLDKPDKE